MIRRLLGRPAAPPQRQASPPATDADIADAYRLILGREPDEAGLSHYRQRVSEGLSLHELITALLGSTEFSTRQPLAAAASTIGQTNSSDVINPKDVIRKYGIGELNETADAYYRRITDPTPLMSKPFTFVRETPEILQNLGFLLEGLHLGIGMTVLDFGAGTCWLSRMFAQMNCLPICCDVSTSALDIGKRLFAEFPLIGPNARTPVFLPFDGVRLNLADSSVDRIVCFDTFHHVPNPAQVVAEFARVLKPGGIIGFSEPGRFHSQSAQSQYEMRNHRVLENDINLREIAGWAEAAGLDAPVVRVLSDTMIPLGEYEAICDGVAQSTLRARLFEETRDAMVSRSVFFVSKGPLRLDSRTHEGLQHKITAHSKHYAATAAGQTRISLTVSNTGTAVWLDSTSPAGMVRLGSHLYSESGELLEVDFSRDDIPRPLSPGESVDITVTIRLPASGSYQLGFDLVAEGVVWFENLGSVPATVTVTRL